MRISTAQIYSANLATMSQQQSDLLTLQQQISTGKRVLRPSDDPVAAAHALVVTQSNSLNTMQMESQGVAKDSLKLLDKKLEYIGDILTYVKTQAVYAGNGSLSSEEKMSMASDISAQFDALLSLANSRDSNDEFMFSGYTGDTQPFITVGGGVEYQGDQGSRCLQVSSTRQIPINVNGSELFMSIDDGAGGKTSMFAIVSNFVTTLQDSSLSNTAYTAALSTVMGQLDFAIDNTLCLSAQTGSREVEVESLMSMGEDLEIQYSDTINRLVGVDYTSAISDYQQQKTYLEAAYNSFSQVSGLSLFKYING